MTDWNAICDVCGFKFKASQMRKRWDNLYVCKDDYEERHPQDFLKGRPDRQTVPWTRPEGVDRYVSGAYALLTEASEEIQAESNATLTTEEFTNAQNL